MTIEEIIRAWKADEEAPDLPANPVGREFGENQLLWINGGINLAGITPIPTCDGKTCEPQMTCRISL